MSGLPERLRRIGGRLAEAARVLEAEVGRTSDGRCKICRGRASEGHYGDDSQPCPFAVVERVISDLAELAAEQPEAPAAGELEWSAVAYLVRQHWPLDETRDSMTIAKRGRFLEELRSLWPASVGELPAGWEAVERAVRETFPCLHPTTYCQYLAPGHYRDCPALDGDEVLDRIKPLWPAPPPPAAWEAIEAKVRSAFEIPDAAAHEVHPYGLGEARVLGELYFLPKALSALRSVKLASAARAAKIEAALRDLLSDWEIETPKRARRIVAEHLEEDPQWETIRDTEVQSFRAAAAELRRATAAALAAPPSDPWAALVALLAELEVRTAEAAEMNREPIEKGSTYHARATTLHSILSEVALRLRAALGLLPAEAPDGE